MLSFGRWSYQKTYKFVQVYFRSSNQAKVQQRCANVHGGLTLNLVMELQEMFHLHHKCVSVF